MSRISRLLLIFTTAVALTAACDSGASEPAATAAGDATTVVSSDRGDVVIESLSLSFDLPEGFEPYESTNVSFGARRAQPPGILTVEPADDTIAMHSERPGETLSDLDLGEGVDARVITNSAMEGLPPGVAANAMLVSNGDASFSAIMSGETDALTEAWAQFVESVSIDGR